MSFRDGWVWWLAIPLLIAMAIWHLLRPRATRHIVPSLQLWQQLLHEQTSTRPWHPPTPWWLLLMRLLIVLLLAGAAANPTVAALSTPLHRIIIIDTSASMQTIEPAGSRIAQARQIATQIVATSPPATTFSLLTIDHDVTLRASQISDRNYLATLIDAVHAQTVAGDITILPAWVAAMRGRTSEVFLVSDDPRLTSQPWPADWHLIAIGGPVANPSKVARLRLDQRAGMGSSVWNPTALLLQQPAPSNSLTKTTACTMPPPLRPAPMPPANGMCTSQNPRYSCMPA